MVHAFINAYHMSVRLHKHAFYYGYKRCYIYFMKENT